MIGKYIRRLKKMNMDEEVIQLPQLGFQKSL